MATKEEAVAAITKAAVVVAVMEEVEVMEAGAILTPMGGPSKEGMTIREEEEAVMANNHP